MAAFIVLEGFNDAEDKNYTYLPGCEYPRKGVTPSDERLAILQGKNKKKIKYIKATKEVAKEAEDGKAV